jgi:hypothetical protein
MRREPDLDDSRRKYRNNLPVPEDTTMRGGQVLLTPGFLCFVGELLFGERWQTPLARWLGDLRGKALAPATVHRWTTESRSIPDWVGGALVAALEQGHRDLERRAGMARGLARRIREALPCEGQPSRDVTDRQPHRNGGESLRP